MKTKAVPLIDIIQAYPGAVHYLITHNEAVICRNSRSGKVKRIVFQRLFENNSSFWSNTNSSWGYFLESDVVRKIVNLGEPEKASYTIEKHNTEGISSADRREPVSGQVQEQDRTRENFGNSYSRIQDKVKEERISLLHKSQSIFDEMALRDSPPLDEVTEVLVEGANLAAMVNRSTLMEALEMGDKEAQSYTLELVSSTREMMKSTTKLLAENILENELINSIVEKSDGTVLQHMTRVFLKGFTFLRYYNNQILNTSLANRLRIGFVKNYKPYYIRLLPHLHTDDISLEHVFLKGMQGVPESEILDFATGFLIHDIGKAKDIEYHEGESGYDRDKIVDHVLTGYKAVMKKSAYSRQAGLITGYHHEYYGDPSGYGYYRAMTAKAKEMNPKLQQDFCISFEVAPMISCQAKSYFPAKILEIVDVFDSLTDPNRKYRDPLSTEEAFKLMKEEFIEKHVKLDPILLDMFIEFVR